VWLAADFIRQRTSPQPVARSETAGLAGSPPDANLAERAVRRLLDVPPAPF
jgi:hypothetical protein